MEPFKCHQGKQRRIHKKDAARGWVVQPSYQMRNSRAGWGKRKLSSVVYSAACDWATVYNCEYTNNKYINNCSLHHIVHFL